MAYNSTFVAFGAKDRRVTVWNISALEKPKYILYGHFSSVISIKILDTMIVSVDKRGILLIHSLNTG